jgi:hypothetical protein
MPHLFRDNAKANGKRLASVLSLDHLPKVGDGGCVELVKTYTDLRGRASRTWVQGTRVIDLPDLIPGTAIATFYNGQWPGWHSGNHAAFFVRVSGREGGRHDGRITEIVVMDQFNTYAGQTPRSFITTRKIGVGRKPEIAEGHISMSNSLEYFYVIE